MPVIKCPDCGKVISIRFPLHDCKPVKNFKTVKKGAV